MRFHRVYRILLWSNDHRDLDYVREVTELVYAAYDGRVDRWQLTDSDQMWQMSFGGRAGVVGIKLNGRVSCAKLFYDNRLRAKLRVALGLGKGRRAYLNGLRLEQAGINCPRMIGYAEQRPTGPGVAVTEMIENGTRLDHWVARHRVQRHGVTALARFVRHLHDSGISHADLSPRNILIRSSGQGFQFILLDHEDARFRRRASQRRRLRNLHHLHERVVGYVPLRDRLRFLHAYTEEDYPFWRDTLRRMIEKTDFRWLRTHAGVNTTSIPSQGNA